MKDLNPVIVHLKNTYNVDLFDDLIFNDKNFVQFYFDMTEKERKFHIISGDTEFIGSLRKDHFRSYNLYNFITFDNIFAEVYGVKEYKKYLINKFYTETEAFSFLLPVKHDDKEIWTRTKFNVITRKNGEPELVFGRIIEFYKDEEPLEVQLYKTSHQDFSTGLFNRGTLKIHIAHNTDYYNTYGLFIDIDNFKDVNDNFGHSMGDSVLQKIAAVFTTNANKDITFYRLGGDEFFAKLSNHSKSEALAKANMIIRDIEKISVDDINFNISASIGLVEINETCSSYSDILSSSDQAMYTAKSLGKGQVYYKNKE